MPSTPEYLYAWTDSGVTGSLNTLYTDTATLAVGMTLYDSTGTATAYTVGTIINSHSFDINGNYTLTIVPTPSDATVTLTATGYTQEGNSISVPSGTTVSYSVARSGLVTRTGTQTVSSSTSLSITLSYASGTVLYESSIAGSSTFTPLVPVSCNIICVGAGGGANYAAQSTTNDTQIVGLAAGGSGGYSTSTRTIDSSVLITVGGYTSGSAGGASSVGSLCSANGGGAGSASYSVTSTGGAAGTGSYSNGYAGAAQNYAFTTAETVTKNGGTSVYNGYGTGASITDAHSRRGIMGGGYIQSNNISIADGTNGYVKITAA